MGSQITQDHIIFLKKKIPMPDICKKAPKILKKIEMLLHKLFYPILQSLFGDHFLYFLAALPLLITIREENGE